MTVCMFNHLHVNQRMLAKDALHVNGVLHVNDRLLITDYLHGDPSGVTDSKDARSLRAKLYKRLLSVNAVAFCNSQLMRTHQLFSVHANASADVPRLSHCLGWCSRKEIPDAVFKLVLKPEVVEPHALVHDPKKYVAVLPLWPWLHFLYSYLAYELASVSHLAGGSRPNTAVLAYQKRALY